MGKFEYEAAEAANLLSAAPSPNDLKQSTALLVAAEEVSKYLAGASQRAKASTRKVTMGIVVRDIERLLLAEGLDESGLNAWGVTVLGAVTSQSDRRKRGLGQIAWAARKRLQDAIETQGEGDRQLRDIWLESERINRLVDFDLDVEAARASRLWDALLRFADAGSPLGFEHLDAHIPEIVKLVRLKIENTEQAVIDDARTIISLKRPRVPIDRGQAQRKTQIIEESALPREYLLSEESAPGRLIEDEWPPGSVPLADVRSFYEWDALDSSDPDDNSHRIRVWFGTNRLPRSLKDRTSPYTNRRTDKLFYGVCRVNVPRVPDASQGLRRFISSWLRVGRPSGSSSVERYYRFEGKRQFCDALNAEAVMRPTEKAALVYVHGFNTSFSKAAESIAEFSLAIKHCGPTAMFSWASKGQLWAYREDQQRCDASRVEFLDFLQTLTRDLDLDCIDIIAHSMGNRLLLRSLVDWYSNSAPDVAPFRNIYLGAPDVATSEFNASSGIYSKAGRKTTLYVSDTDSALIGSRILNSGHGPRAGLTPPVALSAHVDTVETSAVDLSRLRHNYVTEATALRSDVFSVQDGHYDPNKRANLDMVRVPCRQAAARSEYWRFRA